MRQLCLLPLPAAGLGGAAAADRAATGRDASSRFFVKRAAATSHQAFAVSHKRNEESVTGTRVDGDAPPEGGGGQRAPGII